MTRAIVNDQNRVTETYDTLHCGRDTTAGVHALPNINTRIWQCILQARPGNAANVLVGNATQQYFELAPGGALTIPIDALHKVYVNITAGDAVNWLAMG